MEMTEGKREIIKGFLSEFDIQSAEDMEEAGYSRMNSATFLYCHIKAFDFFGGITDEILYDNMKTHLKYDGEHWRWGFYILQNLCTKTNIQVRRNNELYARKKSKT
ncbi:MAG: hypothetical protein UIT85_06155 [Treponema sp.]|nr:hypothetical protein [Treponema sp.]